MFSKELDFSFSYNNKSRVKIWDEKLLNKKIIIIIIISLFQNQIVEDWKFVALVMDRLFLVIFAVSCVVGTVAIIGQAPSLYEFKQPIDLKLSKFAKKMRSFNS